VNVTAQVTQDSSWHGTEKAYKQAPLDYNADKTLPQHKTVTSLDKVSSYHFEEKLAEQAKKEQIPLFIQANKMRKFQRATARNSHSGIRHIISHGLHLEGKSLFVKPVGLSRPGDEIKKECYGWGRRGRRAREGLQEAEVACKVAGESVRSRATEGQAAQAVW
jgi:hypothetical protein